MAGKNDVSDAGRRFFPVVRTIGGQRSQHVVEVLIETALLDEPARARFGTERGSDENHVLAAFVQLFAQWKITNAMSAPVGRCESAPPLFRLHRAERGESC